MGGGANYNITRSNLMYFIIVCGGVGVGGIVVGKVVAHKSLLAGKFSRFLSLKNDRSKLLYLLHGSIVVRASG